MAGSRRAVGCGPEGGLYPDVAPHHPAVCCIDAIGAGSLLYGKPWSTAYAVLVPPTLLLLYAAGWLIERAARSR
jgi:hypothetical protein